MSSQTANAFSSCLAIGNDRAMRLQVCRMSHNRSWSLPALHVTRCDVLSPINVGMLNRAQLNYHLPVGVPGLHQIRPGVFFNSSWYSSYLTHSLWPSMKLMVKPSPCRLVMRSSG